MATGATKMSNSKFNYFQNGKYGTITQKDTEVSQDMHLKMSKKIAQLTKVIYALNTKNDEHEAIVQTIKEQNEDRIQQLYNETRTKIEYYKDKLGDESKHAEKIEALQTCVKQHEREKEKVLAEFESFKQNSSQKESDLKMQHGEKALELSQEVLSAKREFESRMSMLDTLQDQLTNEKEAAIGELRDQHRIELESLRQSLESDTSTITASQEAEQQKHRTEFERLHTDIARLSSEKKQLSEDYEGKMAKAQAFFEKEMDALRNSQNASADEQYGLLKIQYDELKKDAKFAETQNTKRVEDLLHQLVLKEVEVENVKEQLRSLQDHIQNNDSNSSLLNHQLSDARAEAEQALSKLKELEIQLIGTSERCDHQALELVTKSTSIGELEASKLQNESTIHDLLSQIEKMKDRLGWLESSKRALESRTQVLSEEQQGQLKSLQQSLEDMSAEKQKLREQFNREMNSLTESSRTDKMKLETSHVEMVDSLTKEHRNETETLQQDSEKTLAKLKHDLESLLEEERSKHRNNKLAAQEKYEKMKTELMFRVNQAEEDVSRLTKIVEDYEQGLGSATSQVTGLREAVDRLKAELDQLRNELRIAKTKLATVTSEHEQLKITHMSKMKEAELQLKTKLEQMAIALDCRWKDTLRKECGKLRNEITEQKEEDKRAALAQLTKLKEDQFNGAKDAWETKVQELLAQISELRTQLDSHQQVSSDEVDKLRRAAAEESKRLSKELLESAEEYTQKIDGLEETYQEQIRQLKDQRERESRDIESRLRSGHLEDMQATSLAHKAQLSALKEEAGQKLGEELDDLRLKHGQRTESLRTEMEHQHSIEMEQILREHQQQLHAARMELERAIEITRQKEGEHAMKCSELEERVHHRETAIHSLEEELRSLQKGIRDMARELELKGKEILRTRSEANIVAKAREEELSMEYKQQIEGLKMDHIQETQELLQEFNKAQDILKARINQLQILLEEAEDRYRNREPRSEDLTMIQQLHDALEHREGQMKQLLDDKKFFQMELVNRETNFNKVFSAVPNVGVLNPLLKRPKKNDNAPMKFSSAPTLSNRLDPLPGSPLHDGTFNAMRPLPPPTKKFVR